MFKYNNQDHAMATGLYAARNYLGLGDYDPWEVNVDGEYHEELKNKNLKFKDNDCFICGLNNSSETIYKKKHLI